MYERKLSPQPTLLVNDGTKLDLFKTTHETQNTHVDSVTKLKHKDRGILKMFKE